ncbi:hypothetical protein EJ04DRAFT_554714 [Polyplosphaeria fusca]|uniref:Uncharacterized protein n=1 Tax=Polyplosphaeria fusca TaxID=682080 RepID=A0A9P4QUS9_9PLEO|nr:hypothetical protein EJ04DRAFT_554714 [Polyplosphaeria fusca]
MGAPAATQALRSVPTCWPPGLLKHGCATVCLSLPPLRREQATAPAVTGSSPHGAARALLPCCPALSMSRHANAASLARARETLVPASAASAATGPAIRRAGELLAMLSAAHNSETWQQAPAVGQWALLSLLVRPLPASDGSHAHPSTGARNRGLRGPATPAPPGDTRRGHS